jgi:hypothetical protein
MNTIDHYIDPKVYFRSNEEERERLARGESLEDVYPDDYRDDKRDEDFSISLKRNEENKKQRKPYIQDAARYIKEKTPLPGQASFSLRIRYTHLGDYTDENEKCILYVQRQGDLEKRIIDCPEEDPRVEKIVNELEETLSSEDYRVKKEGNELKINGYKDKLLLEKMKETKEIFGSRKIPMMREFLVVNFPNSCYGRGQKNDLTLKTAMGVKKTFIAKYNHLKKKQNSKVE